MSITYLDVHRRRKPTTWKQVFESVERTSIFFEALKSRFYERDSVIGKLEAAMLMREHLLVIGPPGTAKTSLFRTVFSNVQGGTYWARDLTKFDTTADLFGAYDQREMEKTGHLRHMVEGMMPEAHFVHLGEFFDSNDPLLRAMLGVLLDREVRKGPQTIKSPLLTAVADTNFRPEDMPTRAHQIGAVVDRFLFKAEVDNIQDPRLDFELHEAFLDGRFDEPMPTLHLADIERISGLVVGHEPNIFSNKYVLEAYVELKRELSKERAAKGLPPISNRRSTRASQLLEVKALLAGRREVTFDDLWGAKDVLVAVMEDEVILEKATTESVKRWSAKEARHSIEVELAELGVITSQIPQNLDLRKLGSKELLALKKDTGVLFQQLDKFEADSLEASSAARKAKETCLLITAQADVHILRLVESALPKDPAGVATDALTGAQQELKKAKALLSRVNLGSHEVITAHSRVMERIRLAEEIFMRRFAGKEVDDLLKAWG
jgi:MoxR-like ATPase